ncbi:MAG TPA: hypothetical protein VF503_04745 [Sphingobium sp.]|uniref:hypothetical protein n=1 Tax=Sphingobium sp. TaxID=1912891 RepID=UPI002ED3B7B5
MRNRHIAPIFAAALVSALSLGGCAATMSPVDVTRFYSNAVPRGESVVVTPAPGQDAGSIQYRTFANAVAASLTRSGFSVVDSGRPAALSATVDYDTAIDRPVDTRGRPVSVSVGGATGSYGGGMGVGVGIDLSGPPKALISTRLSVRLSRNNEALWEGRAETRAREGTPGAQPGLAAGKLADALFRDYPGKSGATITVK